MEAEIDQAKIRSLEEALRRKKTVETVVNAIMPILLLGALLLTCRALEAALIKLSGVLCFVMVFYAVGTIFGVLAAREVVGKHHRETEDD